MELIKDILKNNNFNEEFISSLSSFSSPLNQSLSSFLISIPNYFSALGYTVDPAFPEISLSLIGNMFDSKIQFNEFDFFEIEPYLIPLLTGDRTEEKYFHTDYEKFVKEYIENAGLIEQKLNTIEKERESIEKDQESLRKLIEEEMRYRQGEETDADELRKSFAASFISNKKIRKEWKEFKEKEKIIKKYFKRNSDNFIKLISIVYGETNESLSHEEIEDMEEELKEVLKTSLRKKDALEIAEAICNAKALLDFHEEVKETFEMSKEKRLEKYRKDRNILEKKIEKHMSKIRKTAQMLVVEKEGESLHHRKEFIDKNNRAVISEALGEPALEKEFNFLTKDEKKRVFSYIHENARKFRTRFSRNIRTNFRHEIDIAETCKKACGTYGVPINLAFTMPKKKKTNLVMFLDISGSCREAAELMLTFMSEMKEVFPGGCKTYVFVNRMFDVSEYFDNALTSEEAIVNIFQNIPTRGVYSDYNTPFRQFYEQSFHNITKDSIVFFIGDARNNQNQTGEEYIRAISRRAKKAYWLNTEKESKWKHGDSIFEVYSKYMSKYCECRRPVQLLSFLLEVK